MASANRNNFNDIVKQGFVKLKSKKLGVWKRRWAVLCTSSSRGGPRLQKYLDEKQYQSGQDCKEICLKNVILITKQPKYVVSIHFNDCSSQAITCETAADQNDWDSALHLVCLDKDSNCNSITNVLEPVTVKDKSDRYHVFLLPTPNLSHHGECIMQINPETIELIDPSDVQCCLVTWPLNALRRYGRDEAKFTFESGRFCDTGEGLFIFHTVHGEDIYQKVHSATLAIAEAHRVVSRLNTPNRNALTPSQSMPLPRNPIPLPKREMMSRSLPSTPDDAPPYHAPTCPTPIGSKPPPLPPPRRASDSDMKPPPRVKMDRKASENVLSKATRTSLEEPSDNVFSPTQPLPSTPDEENEKDEEEYIYEEKYLDPQFRKFLQTRREDVK